MPPSRRAAATVAAMKTRTPTDPPGFERELVSLSDPRPRMKSLAEMGFPLNEIRAIRVTRQPQRNGEHALLKQPEGAIRRDGARLHHRVLVNGRAMPARVRLW